MRKIVGLILIISSVLLIAEFSFAEEKHGWPSLTLTSGAYSFDNQPGLTDEPLYGVKLGYEINGKGMRNRLGIEAVYQRISGEIESLNADVDVTLLRLDVLYLFGPLKKVKNITPFLSVGAGGQFIDGVSGSSSDPLVAYGFGVKFPLSSALALRAEARHILLFANEQLNEFEYTAGLQYTFGKPKKVRKKVPARVDSDNDGIVDEKDQCPETPEGLKVNRTGCPINPPDTDKDGVPDYLDHCPATEQGLTVDRGGCLLDSDHDGVADEYDQCPNNPPGFEVNKDGCMKISK